MPWLIFKDFTACGCWRRMTTMRLPASLWLLLLSTIGSLLFLLYLQDLNNLLPGPKLGSTCGKLLSKCPQDLGPMTDNSSVPQDSNLILSSPPTAKPVNLTEKLLETQQTRQRILKDVCAKHQLSTATSVGSAHVSHIYVEDKYKLLYCEVPKAGCSNWKRTMIVLQGKASNVSQLKHDFVHFGKQLKRLDSFDKNGIAHRLKHYTKVLFLREPFERLVSAFRDKFENDNFYYHPTFGKPIIARYRKNATQTALRTGAGVTFKEFVTYLLDVNRPVGIDIHWQPAVQLCHPCLLNYTFIGKMETMAEETEYILRHIGAPANLTFPSFKDRDPSSPRTSVQIVQDYFAQLDTKERQGVYDFYFMDYLTFNYSKPFTDLY